MLATSRDVARTRKEAELKALLDDVQEAWNDSQREKYQTSEGQEKLSTEDEERGICKEINNLIPAAAAGLTTRRVSVDSDQCA
jgi:hypothetical protein